MNLVILKGRLTRDIALSYGQSGTAYTSFTIAVNRYSKEQETADFIFCTAFGKTAEFIQKYFQKGQEILLKGNIKVDIKEENGTKKYFQKVIIESVEFCGNKKDGAIKNFTEDIDDETEAINSFAEDMSKDEFPF